MEGVIAAVPTPVDNALRPIKSLFVDHCRWALANGCDGLNVLGSTGEATSFGSDARHDVMTWAAEALPHEKLMVGTGTPSLTETIALTTHADDAGFGVALVLPPFYYTPATKEGLIAWYMALHAALGDRPIQIYFYNFPQMTGIAIPVEVIAALATLAPTRFTGIKDSSGDLDYCRAIVAANASLKVFPSSETALQSAYVDGFAGCISASVNITCAMAGEIWATRSAPSAELCAEIAAKRNLIAGPTLIAGIKHLVGRRSGDKRWQRTVPPFTALDADAGDALATSLGLD